MLSPETELASVILAENSNGSVDGVRDIIAL
jgi:hypothetical protein